MPTLMIDLSSFPAVIFDFDGVIVDSETMQARAWTRLAGELNGSDGAIAVAQIAGRLDIEVAAELFPQFDASRCVERKWCIETELEAASELRLIPGAEPLLRRLVDRHELAICSSCHPQTLARRLDRLGLTPLFRLVVGRTEGLRHKPAPDLYQRVLDGLGIAAVDACAIEDSPTGVRAATAAGVYTIQLIHPGMPRASEADAHVKSLEHVKTRSATIDRHGHG